MMGSMTDWRAEPDSRRVDRTTRPIDLVHLAHQSRGDRRIEMEALRLFERQVTAYFERVRAADGFEAITLGLHTLGTAARAVGAVALARQVGEAQAELAVSGRIEGETLDDLALMVTEVSAYIAALLHD